MKQKQVQDKKIRFTSEEAHLINSSTHECWICKDIMYNLHEDQEGYYLTKSYFDKNIDFKDHIIQIICRNPFFGFG